MPVLNTLKSMFGSDEDEDEERFTFECEDCGTVFDASEPARSQVNCPDCESGSVVSAPTKSPAG